MTGVPVTVTYWASSNERLRRQRKITRNSKNKLYMGKDIQYK